MNTTMFIITHKKVDIPKMPGNKVILVGADKNHVENNNTLFDFYDNTGENISYKNESYCELTGIYWAWKNYTCDNIGICHYRRFFTRYRFSNSSSGFFSNSDIDRELEKADVLIPKLYFYEKSVLESAHTAPNAADIEEMKEAIREVTPEYMEVFISFLEGGESCLYNMCIMKKTLFNEYCEWVFKILAYIEERHDLSKEDSYRSRLFGFLSERLLYVWIRKNIAPQRIKEVRVVKTDETAFRSFLHEGKNLYRKMKFKARMSH